MRNTHTTTQTTHAKCVTCRKWFPISKELNELIEDGIISPVDINLCQECAEIAHDEAEENNELYMFFNHLEN